MQFLSSFYVLTTSLPGSHCVYHVPTDFLPRAHHVQCVSTTFLLRPFRSHHALITHLPRSYCVLPDHINATPRALCSHSFCKFSCVNICTTTHPARSRLSSIHSPSSHSHQHKCSLCIKKSLMSLKQNKLQKKFLIHVQVVVETQVMV